MADIELIIKIPEEIYKNIQSENFWLDSGLTLSNAYDFIRNGTVLTPDILADLLMKERIRGELKQDISYSRDIIDDVKCRLTVDIIDHRPCYCGVDLREVWRESEDKN